MSNEHKGGLCTPMKPTKGRGDTWPGAQDSLQIPVTNDSLRQPMSPMAVGIRVRTGEVKPGSPGGSAKVSSPMTTKPSVATPSKMR